VKERLGARSPYVHSFIKAIRRYDWAELDQLCEQARLWLGLYGEDVSQLDELITYLGRNWAYISTPKQRGYVDMTPVSGIESGYRNYTYRMKHQGKSWGKEGLDAMLVVMDERINGRLQAELKELSRSLEAVEMPDLISDLERRKYSTREMNNWTKAEVAPHIVRQARIANYEARNTPMGHLKHAFG
jgi:hypothetical protein